MLTDLDRILLATFREYLQANVTGIVEETADRGHDQVAFVSLGMGVQFALELSQLDLDIARALITALHERQHGDDPLIPHNSHAQTFIERVRERQS